MKFTDFYLVEDTTQSCSCTGYVLCRVTAHSGWWLWRREKRMSLMKEYESPKWYDMATGNSLSATDSLALDVLEFDWRNEYE
jgi:hypothetical protein